MGPGEARVFVASNHRAVLVTRRSGGGLQTSFIVAADVARSRAFDSGVLGGTVVLDGEPRIVRLANGWVISNLGGGPTDDKPELGLEPPADPSRASAFRNLRVADIGAVCQAWRSRIEVGQTTGVPT